MVRFLRMFVSSVLVFAACFVAGESRGKDRVLRLSDGAVISFGEMMKDLRSVDIVFVGELHDNINHHHVQLRVVREIREAGRAVAVGLEMFRAESQKYLDRWVAGAMDLREFLPHWYDNWRLPWPLYRDIFLYSRDQKIPMVGLNVPSAITRKVARQGFAALTKEELKSLPPGISCNVDPRYREFISRAYSDTAHASKQNFEHFCEAQMVWDKSMAYHLVRFLRDRRDTTVVVIAGVGHSWKPGIPAQLSELSKHSYRVVLPEIRGYTDKARLTIEDADYLVLE